MRKLKYHDFYLLKFAFYIGISSYDYSIQSKWVIAWLGLALLMLTYYITEDIKNHINEKGNIK